MLEASEYYSKLMMIIAYLSGMFMVWFYNMNMCYDGCSDVIISYCSCFSLLDYL